MPVASHPSFNAFVTSPRISGRLDSELCAIEAPLTGAITIEECSATIKSIELQVTTTHLLTLLTYLLY